MSPTGIPRARFLKAAGVCIALPALESLQRAAFADAAGALPPRRMVCIGNEFGMYPGFLAPASGTQYEATTLLEPLEPFRRDLTLFAHLDHGLSWTQLRRPYVPDGRQGSGSPGDSPTGGSASTAGPREHVGSQPGSHRWPSAPKTVSMAAA